MIGEQLKSVEATGWARQQFIGRQPILDQAENTFAYELLFRGDTQNAANIQDGDAATTNVIHNAINVMGLSTLVGKHRAFINVTEHVLLQGTYDILPRDRVVIELLEDVQPTPQVIDACHELKAKGYLLALDDFVQRDDYHELLEIADIIKVDFMATAPIRRGTLTSHLKPYRAKLLAEKVETLEDVEQAKRLGYSYFQGYYYQKPVVIEGRNFAASQQSFLQLLTAINAYPFDIDAVEHIIKHDPALATRLLCYINSAFFGLREQVKSVRHGVTLLGERAMRKWASLIAVAEMGQGRPPELIRDCLTRGLFCEMLAEDLGIKINKLDLFMTGLLSLIDTLTGQSKEQIIEQLDLKPEIAGALAGDESQLGDVLRLVEACEKCDTDRLAVYAERLGTCPQEVASLMARVVSTSAEVMP